MKMQAERFRVFVLASLLAGSTTLLAADPGGTEAEGTPVSLPVAQQILQAERSGDLEARANLVDKLNADSEADGLAMSLRGYVKDDGKDWGQLKSAVAKNQVSDKLARYENFRSKVPSSVDGHYAVANWCRKNGLVDHHRTHLLAILQIDSNNKMARGSLGHQFVNGVWMSPEDAAEVRAPMAKIDSSWKKHGKSLSKSINPLQQKSLG